MKSEMSSDKQSPASSKDLKNLSKLLTNPIQTLIETAHSDASTCQNNNDNSRKKASKPSPQPKPEPATHKPSAKHQKQADTQPAAAFNVHNYKHLNKEKLQEIVQRQKDQHDRRIKALEKLTRLEKLQAEKLNKILQMNRNDSICSDAYDSFFQQQKLGEVTLDTENDQDETALTKEILKEEKKFAKSRKHLKQRQDFSDLTVDNDETKTPTPSKSSLKKALFESDDSNMSSSRRQKVAVVKETDSEFTQSELDDDEEEETEQVHFRPKQSVSPVAHSKPIAWAYNQANSFPDHALTPKVVERSYSCCPSSSREAVKMSLQEAFEMNRYDVISRSRQRQKEIQLRAEQRQKEQEYEIERLAEMQRRLEVTCQNHVNQRYIDLKKKPVAKPRVHSERPNRSEQARSAYFEINIENFSGHNKRAMSSQEIKSQTRKNYSKLPEVKQKQVQQRAEEIKRRNRLKSDIYKKVGCALNLPFCGQNGCCNCDSFLFRQYSSGYFRGASISI